MNLRGSDICTVYTGERVQFYLSDVTHSLYASVIIRDEGEEFLSEQGYQ